MIIIEGKHNFLTKNTNARENKRDGLSYFGCSSYRKEAGIGDCTFIALLKPDGQGAATSILSFSSFIAKIMLK
jgi:hypothetical protein